MKYWPIKAIVAMSLLAGCAMTPMMTPADFNAVAIGGNIQDVEGVYGSAFDVHCLPGGIEEHHFIQRIELPGGAVEQTDYVFTVRQGKIVGKERREQRSNCYRYVE